MEKYKWEVLEEMEWRDRIFTKGEYIFDTDNSYMRAMEKQGKVKRAE